MIVTMNRRRPAPSAFMAAAALVLTTAACSTSTAGTTGAGGGDGRRHVVTSFYPIQFATQQIAGPTADVTVLTKPGAEPHDLELTPQDLSTVGAADLVVYAKGFQPAVDEGVAQADPSHVLDVSSSAHLSLSAVEEEHAGEGAQEPAAHGGNDPHFWLDPQRYAKVAEAIGARLSKDDPANAATYDKNTAAFVARLDALDSEFRTGLRSCASKDIVTSHAAFGYLAQRYGLEQHGISGISPEAEPSAAALKAVSDLVRQQGAHTIYQETLVEPHFAETVAGSTGATLATLDPIEGINDKSAGKDYFEVMRSNLKTLRQGQGCS
jgi:zinc transport system substrate-binding protein